MFSFNPELAVGDQTEEGDEVFNSYSRDEDEEEEDDRVWKQLYLLFIYSFKE